MENRQGKAEGGKEEEDAEITQTREAVKGDVVIVGVQRVGQSWEPRRRI